MTSKEITLIENIYDAFANWYHDDGSHDNYLKSEAFKRVTEYASKHASIVSAEKDKEIAELKRKIEADFISIDSLLSEFKRQGFNVSNWDGDEGAEKAIVDGVSVELAAAKERITELRSALLNLMAGVRGLPPLTAIAGVLESQYKDAEKAIENSNWGQSSNNL